MDAPHADVEEPGHRLLCSRQQAWSDLMLRQAVEMSRRFESLSKRVDELDRRAAPASSSGTASHASGASASHAQVGGVW
jgi:hypothetical protein